MPRLARAAMVGLCGALWLAAAALVTRAIQRLEIDCAPLAAAECALAHSLAADGARVEAAAALGCAIAGIGLWWRLKR